MEVEEPSEMKQVLAMLVTQSQEMKSHSTQMAALTTQSAGLSSRTQDLAAKTQVLTEKTQSMSVQVADNANSIHEMSSRLTALEGGVADMGMSGRGLLSRRGWRRVRGSRLEPARVGLLVLLALVCLPLSQCLV